MTKSHCYYFPKTPETLWSMDLACVAVSISSQWNERAPCFAGRVYYGQHFKRLWSPDTGTGPQAAWRSVVTLKIQPSACRRLSSTRCFSPHVSEGLEAAEECCNEHRSAVCQKTGCLQELEVMWEARPSWER